LRRSAIALSSVKAPLLRNVLFTHLQYAHIFGYIKCLGTYEINRNSYRKSNRLLLAPAIQREGYGIYIPERRTPQLLEVQFTILPEDEWLIGLSDLAYFQGIGFSMPIPFNFEEVFSRETPSIWESNADTTFHAEKDNEGPAIASDSRANDIDIPLIRGGEDENAPDSTLLYDQNTPEDTIPNLMSSVVSGLYAFIPGIFYCSKLGCAVDGIVVEIVNKEVLEFTVSNFRPECVRSFDIEHAMSVDRNGEVHDVKFSMSTTGKFATGLSEDVVNYAQQLRNTSMADSRNAVEIDIALQLVDMLSPEQLKQAYVSSPIVTGQLMSLLHDIESQHLEPRCRIYFRNSVYPSGIIIESTYSTLTSLLTLGQETGIRFPCHVELESKMRYLAFARLVGDRMEVDIERAILEMYEFLTSEFGVLPEKEEILNRVFGGDR
jgi:hypothetical protein